MLLSKEYLRADIFTEPPMNSLIFSGLSFIIRQEISVVMNKLNTINTIDIKYNRTIKLGVDLYQETNKRANFVVNAIAVT
jgi:hypothetical protein